MRDAGETKPSLLIKKKQMRRRSRSIGANPLPLQPTTDRSHLLQATIATHNEKTGVTNEAWVEIIEVMDSVD
ncbi:unnamed protein product [Clavelina lepadiformis]|uniref:Uncharacterized protein n=1 Tax=Clavelina lepadiformis TaxID=159417 RepID=A0ABP0F9T7_CLALP